MVVIAFASASHICVREATSNLDKLNHGVEFTIGLIAGFAEGKASEELLGCKENGIDMTDDFIEFLNIIDKIKSKQTSLASMAGDLDHLVRVALKAPKAFQNCKSGADTIGNFYQKLDRFQDVGTVASTLASKLVFKSTGFVKEVKHFVSEVQADNFHDAGVILGRLIDNYTEI